MKRLLNALLLFSLLVPFATAENERESIRIDPKTLPQLIIKTVKREFPLYVIESGIYEKEGKSETYMLALKHKDFRINTQSATVCLDAKGKIYAKSYKKVIVEIPKAINASLPEKYKGASIHGAEYHKTFREGLQCESYILNIEVKGTFRAIEFDTKGTITSDSVVGGVLPPLPSGQLAPPMPNKSE